MKEWLKWMILGAVSLIFGVIVLGNTVAASMAVTTVTGVLFLVSGGFQMYGGVTADGLSSKIFGLALGALMAFLGLSFITHPLEGTISLALLVLILLAASGIVRVVFAWRMRETQYFWPMLISGVLSVLLAAYIGANFQTASVQILGVLLGVELIFNGVGLVILALFMRTVGKNLEK